MTPVLLPGDRVLVRYGAPIGPGQVVVARFADGTLVVKRVARAETTRTGAPAWWLLSDNAEEGLVDSRARGAVPVQDVLGVVGARLWPWPCRIRRTDV
ncbi:MAG: peptidase [Marmoricola sp.]|nr:peptidase [Marmoricola sp.]